MAISPGYDGTTESFAPRRFVLDRVLLEGANDAGAVRDQYVVEAPVIDEAGAVCGIRGSNHHAPAGVEKARLVVRTDGMRSIIARAVRAPKYNQRPKLMGTCFTYWSDVPVDGLELHVRPGRAAYAWQTNAGLTLVGVNWVISDFARLGGAIEQNYMEALTLVAPELAERVRAARRQERWISCAIDNYFRKPYGDGWALVGDAGYKKDPCTASGITDAFRDAEVLADAIDKGFNGVMSMQEALAQYETARNEIATPIYEFTCEQAKFAPPSRELEQILAAVSRT
jgi:flavin-dependent dehydrogenase